VDIGGAQPRERLASFQEKGLIGGAEETSHTTKKDQYCVDDLAPAKEVTTLLIQAWRAAPAHHPVPRASKTWPPGPGWPGNSE